MMHKKKDKKSTAEAMENILSSMDDHPNTIITDEGLEFYNRQTNDVFQKYGILHYSIKSSKKASIAERAIQTFKNHFISILNDTDKGFPAGLWD